MDHGSPLFVPPDPTLGEGTVFGSPDAAWIWAMRRVAEGRMRGRAGDVVKCLDELYRQRRVELLHARVLRIWGLRGRAPDARRLQEGSDWRLWREAMAELDGPLRARGIVGGLG